MNRDAIDYYERELYATEEPIIMIENQTLSAVMPAMHYHDVIEIGIVTKGSGTFIINGEINHFSCGDVSVIFPNDVHISAGNINDESVWTYILIDINALVRDNPRIFSPVSQKLYSGLLPSCVFSPQRFGKITDIVLKLCREQREKRDGYPSMSSALCAELLIEISRSIERSRPSILKDKALYEKISPAIAYILQFYDEEISVKQLSDVCFLSETHFRRMFKQAIGLTPSEYLYQVRISAAKSLLETDSASVLQICSATGYRSQTSFNKHFKRYTGTTPSEYKSKNRLSTD